MNDDPNKHTVRFQIDVDVYGNTTVFDKEQKAEEILNWVIAGRTHYAGCGLHVPDLPNSVTPTMSIAAPKKIKEG